MTQRLAALALVALLAAGCRARGAPATAAPGFEIGDGPPASFVDSVAAYAGRLEFDTTRGAGDEQLLHNDPCPPCTHGPRVAIQAERGSYRLSRAELARGRVIAQLVNRDTTGYDRFALAPAAVVYWWVDSTAAGWRSIFFRASPDRAAVVSNLTIDPHAEPTWWQASARWLWGSAEIAWATCGDKGCCQSGGVELARE